jgi:hypothetical protein
MAFLIVFESVSKHYSDDAVFICKTSEYVQNIVKDKKQLTGIFEAIKADYDQIKNESNSLPFIVILAGFTVYWIEHANTFIGILNMVFYFFFVILVLYRVHRLYKLKVVYIAYQAIMRVMWLYDEQAQ